MPNGSNGTGKRINYALAATLIMSGVTLADAATQVGAKNANVLRVGLTRKGVFCGKTRALHAVTVAATPSATDAPSRTLSITARIATEASGIIAESGRRLRQSLASASEASAGVLDAKPPKSVSQVIQRASALKSLVEAGDKLHGWSAQASAPAWNVTILDRERPASCVSDAISSPQEQKPLVDNVSQVIDIVEVAK